MVKKLERNNQLIKQDLNLLITEGNLGFYKSCEITTIFLYDQKNKEPKNFYTIGVFEEREITKKNNLEHLTKKLIEINKDYSLGVVRYQRTLKDIERDIHLLLEENIWDASQDSLTIGNLKALPKQFISIDSSKYIPLNSVLKNNFYNGSYILEFFDQEKKDLIEMLESDKLLAKIQGEIEQVLPIDLSYINDRIGNIIFQFPSTLLAVDLKLTSNEEGLTPNILWHSLMEKFDEIIIQASTDYDNNLMGFDQIDYSESLANQLHTGNTNGVNDFMIFDKNKGLVLSHIPISFIKNFNMSGFISEKHQKERTITFFDKKDKSIDEITVPIVYSANTEKPQKIDYEYWISNRIYENEKKRLADQLIFVQYGKGINEREAALRDLRKLINIHGINGVYLWDPYLSPTDIMQTLYYYKVADVPMKAISSSKSQENINNQKSHIEKQRNDFEKSSNHVGINLEFRSQHGHYGWKFHDRFVIFPGDNGKPKAWSLGTSINSLGKTHHILQEVSNAQMILDAFMELWTEIQVPECLIWRSK